MFALTAVLLASFISLLVFAEVQWSHPVINVLTFVGMGWFFLAMTLSGVRLMQYSGTAEPVIVMTPETLRLNLWPGFNFLWTDVHELRFSSYYGAEFFEFGLVRKPFKLKLSELVGLSPLKFSCNNLELDPDEFENFLKANTNLLH